MLRGMLLLLRLPIVLRLVTRLMLDRRVPLRVKLILPAAIVYLISPIDVVPDILPVLGRIDDILVLLIALVFFLGLAPREVVSEHLRNARTRSRTPDSNFQSGPTVIEGTSRVVDDGEE